MQVIGVGLHRGGTGKTTTSLHLAAALGERGRKVLLMDLDGNLGLTDTLDVPTVVPGTYDVLMREERITDVIITPENEQERASRPGEPIVLPKNVHLIPGNRQLETFDDDHKAKRELQYIAAFDMLTDPLQELEGLYDYVVLDTAPVADTLTIAAYKNADWFILASTAQTLAVKALSRSIDDIIAAKPVNPKLEVLGVIMSRVDARKKLERAYVQKVDRDLTEAGGFGLFDAVVPTRAVVGKASALHLSLFDYDPASAEVKMVNDLRDIYRGLAREVEDRIGAGVPRAALPAPAEELVAETEEQEAAHE